MWAYDHFFRAFECRSFLRGGGGDMKEIFDVVLCVLYRVECCRCGSVPGVR